MKNKIKILIYSIFTLFYLIYFNKNLYNYDEIKQINSIFQNTSGVLIWLLIIIIYIFYKEIYSIIESKKLLKVTTIGSIIYTTIFIVGDSFYNTNDWTLIISSKTTMILSIIKFIGLFILIRNILKILILKIENINISKSKKESFNNVFLMAIFLFILYLPYVIIFYPGTMNADSLFEIGQFYGKIKWTQHHPILPTIIYGTFMKLGKLLFNDNFGLFLSNIFQMIISCIIISYSITTIYEITKNKTIKIILFLLFALFPIWPINFYSCVKDVWFSIFFLLFMIMTIKLNYYEVLTKKEWFIYSLATIFTILFRNNGIHIVLLSIPFLYISFKKNQRNNFIKCMIISIIICISFNTIITNIYSIKKGSIRETLSLPLQQTARYVVNHKITKKEKKAIEKLVDIENIKNNYNPETIDYIKIYYKEKSTTKDLINYFIIWTKMFFKHPESYISATINSTYGYFYPNKKEFKDDVAQLTINDIGLEKLGFKLKNSKKNKNKIKKNIENINTIRHYPLIGIFFNCGTYSCILIFNTLVLWYKKKKKLLLLSPLYCVILVCIASPVNGLVRYMMPIMITIPFIQIWIIKESQKKETIKIVKE